MATPSSHEYRDISRCAYLSASSASHSGISEECIYMVERGMQPLSGIIHMIPSRTSIWSAGSEISKAQQTHHYWRDILAIRGRWRYHRAGGEGWACSHDGDNWSIAATTIDGQGHRGCALRCHTPNRMQTNMMRIQRYIIQPPGSKFTKSHTIVPNHSWRIR